MQFSSATQLVTKERYVATCQYLLLAAIIATMLIAVAGVAQLDIVGPHASSPTGQRVHPGAGPTR